MSQKFKILCNLCFACLCIPTLATAADQPLPDFLQDRGSGVPTSQFGTYIERGQWMVYPFYEYEKK